MKYMNMFKKTLIYICIFAISLFVWMIVFGVNVLPELVIFQVALKAEVTTRINNFKIIRFLILFQILITLLFWHLGFASFFLVGADLHF